MAHTRKHHELSHLTLTAGPHMTEHSLHLGTRMHRGMAMLSAHSDGVADGLYKHSIHHHKRR